MPDISITILSRKQNYVSPKILIYEYFSSKSLLTKWRIRVYAIIAMQDFKQTLKVNIVNADNLLILLFQLNRRVNGTSLTIFTNN